MHTYFKDVHGRVCSVLPVSATPWTVAQQACLTMEFSGDDTRVGWHLLFQGISLTQGSNLGLLGPAALSGRFFTTAPPGEPILRC